MPSDELRRPSRRESAVGGLWGDRWPPLDHLQRASRRHELTTWGRVAELAGLQSGVAAHWQLRQLGLAPRSIGDWIAGGRLHPVHRGVYAVGHRAIGDDGSLMAAVLACGPGAFLGCVSGARVRGMAAGPLHPVHVSVTHLRGLRRPGVRIHRVRSVTIVDLAVVRGIPAISPTRVLLDLAAAGRRTQLYEAISRAQRSNRLDPAAISELIERSRGGRGVAILREATEGIRTAGGVPKSRMERRFRDLFEDYGIPEPLVNDLVRVEHMTYQVDFHWPAQRLVVEADSYRWHSDPSAHEEDRRRDQELKREGWEVLRFTWRQLTREPARTARVITELLRARTPAE